jgi:hypothetical protein
MRLKLQYIFFLCITISSLAIFSGCKNKDASVLKIYIRSKSNELLPDTKVVIIGDVNSNPPTKEYVDTASTNTSGYATFDMQPYFDLAGEKENPTGYFDIVFKKDTKTGSGRVRCRVHITTVETLYFTE